MMFLTVLPLWVSGILLIGLPTLIAMGGPILIRRRPEPGAAQHEQ